MSDAAKTSPPATKRPIANPQEARRLRPGSSRRFSTTAARPPRAAKKAGALKLTALSIPFDTASDALSLEAQELINETGRQIRRARTFFGAGIEVEVRGYADARGSAVSNRRLSQRRAHMVEWALLEDLRSVDVPVDATGFGETQPRCRPEDHRNGVQVTDMLACNRRVEILLIVRRR